MIETSNWTVPPGSCDSHLHIYESSRSYALAHGSPLHRCDVQKYVAARNALGLQRAVVVNPAPYVVDNSVTLAAIQMLGRRNTRGMAVVFPHISDEELGYLDAGGIRGIRFTLANANTAVTHVDMIEPLAARVHELGWHVQLHMTADQIVAHQALLASLKCTLVFDHMARLAQELPNENAWRVILALLERGTAWVKLSGHYLAANAAMARLTARRLLDTAPQRLVWGSDWPHPTEMPFPPQTSSTLDVLHEWVADDAMRQRILVDNPCQLYGFE